MSFYIYRVRTQIFDKWHKTFVKMYAAYRPKASQCSSGEVTIVELRTSWCMAASRA